MRWLKRMDPSTKSVWKWALSAAIIMTLLLYVPTPFAAYEPGVAVSTQPLVHAKNPDDPSAGNFILTTVKLSEVNFWMAMRSAWDQDLELFMKKDLLKGKTPQEYKQQMSVIMLGSQSSALEAAYQEANIPYRSETYGLVVTDSYETGSLQQGDELLEVNGEKVTNLKQLAERIQSVSGALRIAVERKGKQVALQLPGYIPSGAGGSDAEQLIVRALGIKQIAELRRIVSDDPSYAVSIKADGIGGPSAGLMFALQALDDLTPGDLTAGLKVAGTGTIAPDGTVGAIGGVSHKVVAASKAGAQIFLVPRRNAKEATEKVEKTGFKLEIIPVDSLKDAVKELYARQNH